MSEVTAEGSPAADQPEVVRWYTHARRFPILVGKAGMNGDPLPGGPYTSTQVVAWFATLAGLYFTRGIWGQFGTFTNGIILLGLPIAVGWAARWIPHDARNPILVAAGWARCFAAPPAGRVDGVPLRPRAPYRMRHQFVVDPRSTMSRRDGAAAPLHRAEVPAPSRAEVPEPTADMPADRRRDTRATPAGSGSTGLTGVQALLAAAPGDQQSGVRHVNERQPGVRRADERETGVRRSDEGQADDERQLVEVS